MGWYEHRLDITPSLVAYTGGLGRGFNKFGNALVNLGNDKVEQARQKALENEKKLKLQAQAEYNRAVNPDVASKMSPDKLGYVDIKPVKLPKISKTVKLKDGRMAEVYDDGSVKITDVSLYNEPKQILQGGSAIDPITGRVVYTNKKPQKPTTKGVLGKDGKVHLYQFDTNSNKWGDTGLILPKSGSSSGVKAPVSVKFGDLSLPEKMYASTHQYLLNGNNVNYSQLKSEMQNRKKPDKNFGNMEVK